ncbi:O-antigen ligase family protein [uncultured Flavobacterium sp.]|uniref:O-antigen ligase family protein n=1 Tax=uncultured Flavobacterium sp. TaxID=165435 RepID=UPI0030CA317B
MKYNAKKAFPFLISLLFLFPLFKENIVSFIFILVSLNTIIYQFQNKSFKRPKKEILLLTIPFWIVFILSLFYFDGLQSLKPISNSMFFLLFPILFNYIPEENFSSDKLNKYINILKNASLLIIVYYLVSFFYNYTIYDFFIVSNNVSKFRNFVYNELLFFKIHPAYFTTILVFCTAFSLKEILQKKKWVNLIYVFFFILITFLLLTKINIIYLTCLLISFVFFQIKKHFIQKVLVFGLLLGGGSFLVNNTPGLNERFYELSVSLTKVPNEFSYNSTNIRVAIYNCDYQIIKENFWFGVGFNNIIDEIDRCLNSTYNSSFTNDHNYLSHNYYMYILISGGIFSLLFFLFYLYTVLKVLLKTNLFICYAFFINCLTISMIEDFFFRAYGLFFFNLIVLMFYKNNQITGERYIVDESDKE